MLVLSRKKNETIIINDNIAITVVDIRGDRVRLGIEAPREISVHRAEIYSRIGSQSFADPSIASDLTIVDNIDVQKPSA